MTRRAVSLTLRALTLVTAGVAFAAAPASAGVLGFDGTRYSDTAAVRKDLPIAATAAIAHRALHALDDAWADHRLHGADAAIVIAGGALKL